MDELAVADRWHQLLDRLQVSRGETVCVGIDMGHVPLPSWKVPLSRETMRQVRARSCEFVLAQLMDRIGPDGTLLVPTFSYSCSRPGARFYRSSTPSEVGPFTEYVRTRPEAIRSLHPIFSMAGIGRNAEAILTQTGGAGFGPASPFGRMEQFGTRFLSLGISFTQWVTYVHHMEQSYGCNHRFNKVIEAQVDDDGKIVDRVWLAYLRYLSVESSNDLRPLEKALFENGALLKVVSDDDISDSVLLKDVNRIGYRMLAEDPCAFASPKVLVHFDETELTGAPVAAAVARLKITA
jgi:aminoglycoside 3-N-acetyltransferase